MLRSHLRVVKSPPPPCRSGARRRSSLRLRPPLARDVRETLTRGFPLSVQRAADRDAHHVEGARGGARPGVRPRGRARGVGITGCNVGLQARRVELERRGKRRKWIPSLAGYV